MRSSVALRAPSGYRYTSRARLYAALIPLARVFTAHLRVAPYVARMNLGNNADRHRGDAWTDASSYFRRREEMAGWRWFLFAVMARFEVSEDVYLRIPGTKVTRCDGARTNSEARDSSGDSPRVTSHDLPTALQKRARLSPLEGRLVLRRLRAWFKKGSLSGVKIS
jgi:hypothetical protein